MKNRNKLTKYKLAHVTWLVNIINKMKGDTNLSLVISENGTPTLKHQPKVLLS
jgi:hypothetical protein